METFAGILLAAGRSTRMGDRSKLLLTFEGEPIVRRAAKTLLAAGVEPLVVVVPAGSEELREVIDDLNVLIVENQRRDEGMATSIAAGVAALGAEVGQLAIALGDMPLLQAETIIMLCQHFSRSQKGIALPTYEGRRGHPVLFDLAKFRGELLSLEGDSGAKSILKRHDGDLLEVAVQDPGVVVDIDTPNEAAQYLGEGH